MFVKAGDNSVSFVGSGGARFTLEPGEEKEVSRWLSDADQERLKGMGCSLRGENKKDLAFLGAKSVKESAAVPVEKAIVKTPEPVVEEEDEEDEDEDEDEEGAVYSKTELSRMLKSEVAEIAASADLDTEGTKDEIIERILAYQGD